MERICFLDFTPQELTSILSDEKLAQELSDFDESSALTHIDELVNLNEDPTQIIVLNGNAVAKEREYWTVEIPDELASSLRNFLQNLYHQ